MSRLGDYICTSTGVKFYPLDPRPEEINIEDIAHALSNICRYGGHAREFYSVGQHSVLAATMCPFDDRRKLHYLLHDAEEAYIGDITRPLRKHLRTFDARATHWSQTIETVASKIVRCVEEAFHLPPINDDLRLMIAGADLVMLASEVRDLMPPDDDIWRKWTEKVATVPFKIEPWSPKQAKEMFLNAFHEINNR